jgi:hypothetical protein
LFQKTSYIERSRYFYLYPLKYFKKFKYFKLFYRIKKSKFWIGASGDLNSIGGDENRKNAKPKAKTRLNLCVPVKAETNESSRFGYGPHNILQKHVR